MLGNFRGWEFCNWEKHFSKDGSGHDALVRQLKKLIRYKYHLNFGKLDDKEESIAWRPGEKPIFAHNPDVIINIGEKPEDRIFIEYVNTTGKSLQNFIRDFRGMLALSAVVKRCRGFVLAIRHSIYPECWRLVPHAIRCDPIEIMSLKSLFFALDHEDYDYLVGRVKKHAT